MDRNTLHYHIRWSIAALDWERFNTHSEAEASAKQLARAGETFTIDQFEGDCARCRDVK
jgi:hypothetical protein